MIGVGRGVGRGAPLKDLLWTLLLALLLALSASLMGRTLQAASRGHPLGTAQLDTSARSDCALDPRC